MTRPAAAPDPEPDPDAEPPDENDDKAWARFAPRFKALQKETLNEWMKERGVGDEPAAAGGSGAAPAAGGAGSGGGEPDPITAPRKVRQAPRPSGGSIFDLLLGK